MPVGVFKRLLDIDEASEDRVFEMVAALCQETLEDTLSRPLADVKRDIESLEWLEKKPKVVRARGTYRLGDTTYTFISDPGDVITSQYIDFCNTPKDVKHITEMLSIVLVPKGHTYGDGYSFDKVAQDIDTYLMYEDANAITAFFLGLWLLSQKRAVKEMRKSLKMAVKEKVITKDEAKETLKSFREVLALTTGYPV